MAPSPWDSVAGAAVGGHDLPSAMTVRSESYRTDSSGIGPVRLAAVPPTTPRRQQRLDGGLTPPLTAIRLRLAPPSIGVHRLVAQRGELGDQARFPGARHLGDQHPPYGPSLCRRDPEHPAWILIGGTAHSAA